MTLIEILNSIEGGDEEYFDRNRDRLRALAEPGLGRILRFPGAFLLERLYGNAPIEPAIEPDQLEMCLKATLRAKDRAHLRQGVWLPGMPSDAAFKVDLPKVREKTQTGKQQHVERLERIRKERHEVPDGRWWAGVIVEGAGHPMSTVEECDTALAACSAAYHFDAELFREVRGKYAIEARDSDWMDIMQLLYLSDPRVRMLTLDATMIRRIRGSTQAAQVIELGEFLRGAGAD